jgi:hypothetical protein
MIDNLKSAVLKRVVGEAPVFNPRYLVPDRKPRFLSSVPHWMSPFSWKLPCVLCCIGEPRSSFGQEIANGITSGRVLSVTS